MADFRAFEFRALRLLVADELSASLLNRVCAADVPLKYDYTGVGYLLTLSHPELPTERAVLSHPSVTGYFASTVCSFVAFLGDNELTLECCSLGPDEIPADFRDQPIELSVQDLLP